VCCREAADDTPSTPALSHGHLSDVNCRPSTQSSSGHVTSLIETLQPPPPLRSPTLSSGRSLMEMLHSHTSTALRLDQSCTLAGGVLGGVDLSLAAVVLGSSPSPAVTPAPRLHVTRESPERTRVTSPSRPASSVGRRSAGVPHGSVRALQQQHSVSRYDNTLLVVPSPARSASSSPTATVFVNTRGGSVSTSPSSASPSPSPEPVSRHSDCRSLSTQRPLGITHDLCKPARTCVQRHCDQQNASHADELHEQETFV